MARIDKAGDSAGHNEQRRRSLEGQKHITRSRMLETLGLGLQIHKPEHGKCDEYDIRRKREYAVWDSESRTLENEQVASLCSKYRVKSRFRHVEPGPKNAS